MVRFSPKIQKGRNRSAMVTRATTATRRTSCSSFIGIPPSGFAQQHQQQGDDRHGGDQENVLSKHRQTQGGGSQAGDGGEVILRAEPLLHENGDEQGGEDEFDALIIDGDQRARQRTQHGARDPVNLVEQGNQEAVAVAGQAFRGLVPGNQGIGFVRQGKNKVGLFLAGALVGIHHGDTVEQVPGVDNEGGQGGGQQPGAAGQEAYRHVLHGTGVDKQAHGGRPEHAVAMLVQQDTKAEAQEDVARHHRHGIEKSGSHRVLFHRGFPLSEAASGSGLLRL